MPFPMVHFHVAQLLSVKYKIDNLPQFHLGILAPDAVHSRKKYSLKDRRTSHLTVENETLWQDEVIKFIKNNKNNAEKWLYIGYGIHILTDILWENMIYKPFYQDIDYANQRKIYVHDMTMIDLWLYRNCQFKEVLWSSLFKAESLDVFDLVTADEINQERSKTLVWYDEKADKIVEGFKYISPEQIIEFIKLSSRDIFYLLR